MGRADVIIILEVIVAIIATITFYKYRHNNLRYFLLYVWIIFLVETLGTLLPRLFDWPNLSLYNTLVIFEFPMLILWYRSFITGVFARKILIWLILLLLTFFLINTLFVQPLFSQFQSYNFICGAVGLILAILLYFNEILHTEKIIIAQHGLLFWVSVGFLFFYASVIPIMIVGNIFNHTGSIYNAFLLILNIILHVCFLIGLLWGQKKYN